MSDLDNEELKATRSLKNIDEKELDEMIKCNCCGKEIDSVIIGKFNYDGSDNRIRVNIEHFPENANVITFDKNWVGYDLTEEEQIEDIQCPYCKKFPFKQKEVQVHEYIHIVCFN